MLTILQNKGRGSKTWAVRQCKYTEIHLHLLRIIHLEISIQNISLVLSCESHPKCKLKATDNCNNRTLHKVINPCTHRYKHRCFIPGGNNTSLSLMFLPLKLDIRGHRGGPRGIQEVPWRALPPGRASGVPGALVVALWSDFGDSRSLRDTDFLYNFPEIFWGAFNG